MRGQKMHYAREAARFAVENLLPCDRLSVVLFDDRIETLVPSTLATDKHSLLEKLRHVHSRGLSPQALKVLTILHNFDLQRPDGTTAAQRLFGHPFPDLFESVLSTFTELPMPRRSSVSQQLNPWHSQTVPA